ncbi:alpha/beta fold hydrolase [Streptomyces sp. NRRL WC-3742]|uniref:alpha/beta fold hydrolase n=1 Tax=Streptomyces sp. NRRL WC-3742 TaxID=1463934 RepID=UPI000A97812D|nr:alpha/beta hydrolase [Streptomyces sp. NRRL WC-3742]
MPLDQKPPAARPSADSGRATGHATDRVSGPATDSGHATDLASGLDSAPGTGAGAGSGAASADGAADGPTDGVAEAWSIRQAGPWTHRDLAANGARFHIAELGSGPLVLLVHGWPEYWWAWRHQLTALAEAGYRAVALDLRGIGGSDRTPRGYDPGNLALDITGVIRSLGERRAHLVGHASGGTLAWVAAVMRPSVIQSLTVVSAAHPRDLRRALLTDRRQFAAFEHVLGFQRPWIPERRLVADDAALVGRYLEEWSRPNGLDATAVHAYRQAIQIPSTAHCSIEPYRWLLRSLARPDGIQFARRMKKPITAPTLHVQGASDPVLLSHTALGGGEYVAAPYRWRLLPGVGHFPHEEAPEEFTAELLDWVGRHKE